MSRVRVNYWAEGPTDRFVARKVILAAGGVPGDDYSGRRRAAPGKHYLDNQLARFNAAAHHAPWLVLRDSDGECALEIVDRLLPSPTRFMRFRVVVQAVEAWLIADRQAFADFLGVSVALVAAEPESLIAVKSEIVTLAARSRYRRIREAFCPDPRSGRRVGPEYSGCLIEFAEKHWALERARTTSRSLDRAMMRTAELLSST